METKSVRDRGFRVRQTAGPGIRGSERDPETADVRRIVAGAFERLDRLLGVALKEKDETGDFPVDGGKVGIEPERRLDGGGRLGMIAGEQLDVSQGYLCLGVSGAERDGSLGRGDRFLVAAIHDLHDAKDGIGR